jgi:hypothetical protein
MAANIGVQLARVDAVGIQVMEDLRVAFFEQGHHQVLGTDVVMVVITAFLFGYAQNAQ